VHRRASHCLLDCGDTDRPCLSLALDCGAHTMFRGDKVDAVVARRVSDVHLVARATQHGCDELLKLSAGYGVDPVEAGLPVSSSRWRLCDREDAPPTQTSVANP